MKLKSTPKFDKAYRKFVRRQPHLQKKIDDALQHQTCTLSFGRLKNTLIGSTPYPGFALKSGDVYH